MGLANAGKRHKERAVPTFETAAVTNNDNPIDTKNKITNDNANDNANDNDTNISTNINTNEDNEYVVNDTIKGEGTTVNDIVNQFFSKPKPKKKIQVSFYIDEDIAKEFDKFAKKNGKGAKSELINNFLKEVFGK